MSKALASVFVPALKEYSEWGELSKNPQGIATKEEFIKYTDNFVEYLDCKSHLKNQMKLTCQTENFFVLSKEN